MLHAPHYRSRGDIVMFFGTYLVRRGVITPQQFVAAVELQQKSRCAIGQIALRKGLLSMKQLFEILATQADSPKLFGEIAVEKGFISEKELGDLLLEQRTNLKPLGDVLVEMGVLSEAECREAWHALQEHVRENDLLQQKVGDELARECATAHGQLAAAK
jgi:hypothetical protein